MPDAIVMADAAGRIAFANAQAELLFQYPPAELVGQAVEILLPERYRRAHVSHRSAFFSQPRTRSMGVGLELYGLRKNGEEFSVEISLSPLQTEEGLLVSSAIRDVTERKRVEESLQQANRLKSQFLANMSHELRTPLNGIIGFSQLLVDGKAGTITARQQQFLKDILDSGTHLLQLVNDLLDLSKIEAVRMGLNMGEFSVPFALNEIFAVVYPLANDKRVVVHTSFADVDQVWLDRQKLKQILLNLLSNSLKFTDAGGQVGPYAERRPDSTLQLHLTYARDANAPARFH